MSNRKRKKERTKINWKLVGYFVLFCCALGGYTENDKEMMVISGFIIALIVIIKVIKYLTYKRNYRRMINQQEQSRTSAQYERSLMTPSLRYEILRRDGFRCQICGRTQADGVRLHVDHIVPISKGGKTEYDNLRVLCEDCNLGKGARYDPDGYN